MESEWEQRVASAQRIAGLGSKKTVLIIDDHALFREGLRSLFTDNPRFEVVGEAGNANDGIEKAKDLKPDLVVMDISLPDKSGIEATRSIRRLLSRTKVVVLSMHSTIDYITGTFQAGSMGYVVKESASERLMECLEAVSNGEPYIDSSLSQEVAERLMKSWEWEKGSADARYNSLTRREQQVLCLIAEGLTTKKIAKELLISPKTVENHRSNIMGKLGLHSTIELVRYAAKLGLFDVNSWKA